MKTYLKEFEEKYNYKVINSQQGGESWFHLKLGVISASNAGKVIAKKTTATRLTYLHTLAAQVLTKQHASFGSEACDWGTHNESAARASYEMMHNCELEELPFIFKDDTFRCGASPDALNKASGDGVEIKCPFGSVNHMAFIASDKIKPEYLHQIQFSMWVMGIESWNFCSFDPRFSVKPLAVKIIKRDSEAQKKFDDLVPEFITDLDDVLMKFGVKFGDQWTQA